MFDFGQSNSEHSRHWFFKGKIVIDGEEQTQDLMSVVGATMNGKNANDNSLIAFHDNSSAIRGYQMRNLQPTQPGGPCEMVPTEVYSHITFTAETHNFPTGIAPFPGAATGIGGRIRDGHATGTGSLIVASTAGYCVGNLNLPGYDLPWEDKDFQYPTNLASPQRIIIEGSNGCSAYGNEFGEPILTGFARSFEQKFEQPDGTFERRGWLKPILFTGGVGQIHDEHCVKGGPKKGYLVVKLGGPAYRIGLGGGAASSMVQGDNKESLDFDAVQRGDAEMEQKTNRVIRACVEMGPNNPIVAIHDQGAGGNCNVLKEIVEPMHGEPGGGRFDIRKVLSGDPSLSVHELWCAEFQENDGLLLKPEDEALFASICAREHAPYSVVGEVTGDGIVVVEDSSDGSTPVNLDLQDVLADLPQKTFTDTRQPPYRSPPLKSDISVNDALDRVLRLMSVGSKRFLTSKVDRSVTGLVAQQQCVGPLHTPLADVAVTAMSFFEKTGSANAIGEQPIKTLINPSAMARLTVGESLTNLVMARITAIGDVKVSGNWQWAAKLPHECAALWDAAIAMRDCMLELGVAVQGGKDSLSMAAKAPEGLVKAPGSLVISSYAACPDITLTVTPDFKMPGESTIVFVDLGKPGQPGCLGGSSLAQTLGVLGGECPDLHDTDVFVKAFNTTQDLLDKRLLLSGHDRSDGGLIVTLLEMAFAGNCGFHVDLAKLPNAEAGDPLPTLFGEELGLVFEVKNADASAVVGAYTAAGVPCVALGTTLDSDNVTVVHGSSTVLDDSCSKLRDVWEATSFELQKMQTDHECVAQEQAGLAHRTNPAWKLTYTPSPTREFASPVRVAILRTEGTNGDREMTGSFFNAGFETWDVTVSDLAAGRVNLDGFRGLAMCGGFSYADVLDSAKGWAATAKFDPLVRKELSSFYERTDTFSLGVCNGCQLMALLGTVPFVQFGDKGEAKPEALPEEDMPRFYYNKSGRFESRFPSVTIKPSPAIMLDGMEGSTLGVWIACGEGRAHFPKPEVMQQILDQNLAPIRFADDLGNPTETYPENPTGAPEGIASICSPDGRHLAMMPHPERLTIPWQFPYLPESWKAYETSPWLKMFQNAREWCDKEA